MMNEPDLDHPGLRRTRRTVSAQTRLQNGPELWDCELLDLSMSGARLKRPADFEASVGQPLVFEIQLAGGSDCRLECRVTRISREHLAIGFEHMGADDEARLNDFIERRGRLLDSVDSD